MAKLLFISEQAIAITEQINRDHPALYSCLVQSNQEFTFLGFQAPEMQLP
jgi:hypothetical protein